MDPIDLSSLEGDVVVDNSASFVNVLAKQVEGMRAVYDEANALKEQQRVLAEKRHAQVLAEISALQQEIVAETKRFLESMDSLEKVSREEIGSVRENLLELIQQRFQETVTRMEAIEAHQIKLDAALEEEIVQRKRQTEELVGSLRDQLIVLNTEITRETEIRKTDVARLKKAVEDKILGVNRALEDERFQRDLTTKTLKEQLQSDLDRTDRRQLRVVKCAEELVDGLAHAVRTEAKIRGATQTSIVQCVTVFVEKFKNNLDAEVNLNKN